MTGRTVEFSFYIPFDGRPAALCEESIRKEITHSLLNSLSEIHPDIVCAIQGVELEADVPSRRWRQHWDEDGRRWIDRWNDGAVREPS